VIHLLWATSRPEVFREQHELWMRKAHETEGIETHVAVDSPEDAAELNDFKVSIVHNPRKGITTPLYHLTSNLKGDPGDIVVVGSDDFEPPNFWEIYLKNRFKKYDGALWVNDGHGKKIVSIPIMGYRCLLALNRIIYNPVYNHTFSDQELWDVLTEMNLLQDRRSDTELFEHHHPVYGKRRMDESYRRSERAFHENKALYKQRKSLPLAEKLIVP